MKEEKKPLTPFEEFAHRRIAEFPSMYHSQEDVISQCILGSMGECTWQDGILIQQDQHFDQKTKKWTQYPLRMPLEEAAGMHVYKWPSLPYDIGRNARAPIANLPQDADPSYLQAIDVFLFIWEDLSDEEWEIIAKAKCLAVYQRCPNEHAGEPDRTFKLFLKFKEMIPKWRAAIREVEYFQRNGHIDPRTFMASDI